MTTYEILEATAKILLSKPEFELFKLDPTIIILGARHLKENEQFFKQNIEQQLRLKGYDV